MLGIALRIDYFLISPLSSGERTGMTSGSHWHRTGQGCVCKRQTSSWAEGSGWGHHSLADTTLIGYPEFGFIFCAQLGGGGGGVVLI